MPEEHIDPVNVVACEACAERGRPNEPVYKIGMCRFCYHGLPHPKATSEQLAREQMGTRYSCMPVPQSPPRRRFFRPDVDPGE